MWLHTTTSVWIKAFAQVNVHLNYNPLLGSFTLFWSGDPKRVHSYVWDKSIAASGNFRQCYVHRVVATTQKTNEQPTLLFQFLAAVLISRNLRIETNIDKAIATGRKYLEMTDKSTFTNARKTLGKLKWCHTNSTKILIGFCSQLF